MGEEVRPKGKLRLPQRSQDDLIKGTKYAYLVMDDDGRPRFQGTAGHIPYNTEDKAFCGSKLISGHTIPDPECSCGFYLPYHDQARILPAAGTVELEVEIGGRVVRYEHGYHASWQRVLSVTLGSKCAQASHYGKGGCAGEARWLCQTSVSNGTYNGGKHRLIVCCAVHMRRSAHVISKPLSWLREELGTEIRPGTVTDEIPKAEADRLAAVDAVALQQYPVRDILDVVTMPPGHEGDLFRVCIDLTSKMTYEFIFQSSWQIHAIYHPMLEPWGWGVPPA